MKRVATILLCLSVMFTEAAWAQDSSSLNLAETEPSMRTVLLQAVVGSRVKVRLQGNVILVGSLKSVKGADCLFHVEGEKEARTFAIDAIQSLTHFAPVPEAEKTDSAPTLEQLVEAAIDDGKPRRMTLLKSRRTYTGRVQAGADATTVKVELSDGVTVEIPLSKIRSVASADAKRTRSETRSRKKRRSKRRLSPIETEDPNRTRYLFAPSAMMLRKGDGYFSQKQLGFSEVAYGVHENVTIVAGSVLPAWLLTASGFNLSLGAKAGFEIVDNLHWAAGAYGLVVPGFGSGDIAGGGFLFTTLTGGTERYHVSVTLGVPFIFGEGEEFFDPIVVVAGNVRVSDGLALVSENWLFPTLLADSQAGSSINSLAFRFITDDFATDVGLVHVLGLSEDAPLLPWLDFTFNWGAYD